MSQWVDFRMLKQTVGIEQVLASYRDDTDCDSFLRQRSRLNGTNECNLACAFCYCDPTRPDRLSLDEVKSIMESLPNRSVNLSTGENGMHPDFRATSPTCAPYPSSSR
jgi:molybdenum cofactor biosynthesis enzyme MoaA